MNGFRKGGRRIPQREGGGEYSHNALLLSIIFKDKEKNDLKWLEILILLACLCVGRCAHGGIKCLVLHLVHGGGASAQLSPSPEHVPALPCSSALPAGSGSVTCAELVHVTDQTSGSGVHCKKPSLSSNPIWRLW